MLERTSDLYLKPGTKREKMSIATTVAPDIKSQVNVLNSRVVNDMASITRLFDAKISSLKLLFRASENGYSIR